MAWLGIACVFLSVVPPSGAADASGEARGQSSRFARQAKGKEIMSSYVLLFHGNTFFSDKQLLDTARSELADFDRRGQRKTAIDDASFLMEQAYKKAGFAFATIEYEFNTSRGEITFRVDEGPRVLISGIVIAGNSFFKTPRLQQYFHTQQNDFSRLEAGGGPYYVDAQVKSAMNHISDLYASEGYLDAQIQSLAPAFVEDKSSVSLAFAISEGPRYITKKIVFSGDVLAEAKNELLSLGTSLEGEPYFKRRKLIIRSRILDIYGNLGYPDVAVDIDEEAGEKTGEVVLLAAIRSGVRVTISQIAISGNLKTKTAFIENRLQLRLGDYYSHTRKRESFHALYKTGLFSRVELQLQETEAADQRTLAVTVEEALSRELSFEGGWGSYELLRLGFGYRDNNFLGTGRIIRTEGHYSLKGENALVGFTDPWFLGTDIVADLPFSYRRREEPSFTQQDIGATLLLSRKLSQSRLATLGYVFRFTEIRDPDILSPVEISDTGYNFASLKAQVTWDTRNDPFFPSSGYKYVVSAETADESIGSEINLVRFTAGARYFLPLTPLLTLGLRYTTGLVLPTRNQITLPLGERFYNGGENTVRGFRESELGPMDLNSNPVGGMAFNIVNLELRRRFSSNLAMTFFADLGNVSPNRSQAEAGKTAFVDGAEIIDTTLKEYFRDFRLALGVGFQYLLPVGPLRLDFAWNPEPRTGHDENSYEIHFSVGMAF